MQAKSAVARVLRGGAWNNPAGNARSASVIDRPHVGQATQAIDQRRTVEISSVSGTRCLRRICSRVDRLPAAMLVNRMLW